jgi:predicted PurR-regulated permease PerM
MMEQSDRCEDNPAWQIARIAYLLRFLAIATPVGFALWLLHDVALLVFAAALFAVLLHGLGALLSRMTRLPYQISVGIVLLLLFGALGWAGWSAGPHLTEEAVQLRDTLLRLSSDWRTTLDRTEWGRLTLRQLPSLHTLEHGDGVSAGLAGSVAGFFESVFGALGTFAVIVIAGLYFALSPQLYVEGALRLLPVENREKGRAMVHAAGDSLWHWIAGQAVDMVCVGVMSGIGLSLLGVPLAMALGVLAGLMNFVPYIGAIVGFLPAILIALSNSPRQALYVALLYAVIQGVEGNILGPLIQRRAANLAPALTILSQTTIGALFGLPGLVLATPLAAALVAVVQVLQPPLPEDATP